MPIGSTQIADPTVFGHPAGEGPLRVGGEAQSTDVGQQDLPSTRSKRSQAQMAAVEICRDLSLGNPAVKAKSTLYLPRGPAEQLYDYNGRLRRALFTNFYSKTIDGLVGLIFRKDPKLGDDVPAVIAEHWENIDLMGTHGDVFVRDLTDDAMRVGHCAVLVDFPRARAQTRADDGRLRPYWVPIKKEQIMSWRERKIDDENGSLVVLDQVVIEFRNWEATGQFTEAERVTYLVCNRSMIGAPTWRKLEVTKNREVKELARGVFENQTEIPIAEIGSSGTMARFVSQPPLLDLAYQNLAHYQMWSDYSESIHKTNVPILVLSGITTPKGGSNDIAVGANTVFTFSDPNAKAMYVSHDGAALGSTKTALDDLKSDMGTTGLAMLAPQKRAAETAEAKRLDKATSDSALSVTARLVQDGIEQALVFHANYLRADMGGSIEINRDFEGLVMEAPVMQAYAALMNAGFPGRAILEMLQRGGRLSEDADLDELELEMMANAEAAARARAEIAGLMEPEEPEE